METIKFFEDEFSIVPVMNVLRENEASYKLICDSWKQFGYSLGLFKGEIDGLGEKISSERGLQLQLIDVPREILRLWKNNHKEQANLKVLYEALKDVCAEDLAGSIRERFGGAPTPSTDTNVDPTPSTSSRRIAPAQPDKVVRKRGSLHVRFAGTATAGSTMASPAPKRRKSRRIASLRENEVEMGSLSEDNPDLNSSDAIGDFPLLQAIREGESVAHIKKMLDNGANVNVKTLDEQENNAAHEIILSLLNKRRTTQQALAILKLLWRKGFSLINDKSSCGFTPLQYAMQYKGLTVKLLNWFHRSGSDFNAVELETGYSVVLQAIGERQNAEIINKIHDFGGDPKYLTKWKGNALHVSAMYANDSAMQILLKKLDINEKDEDGCTPLHLLFYRKCWDYQNCLELLLRNGADFGMNCNKGYVPLVTWITENKGNPFPTLVRMKARLPISADIASAALTAIVEKIERLQDLLSSSSRVVQNEFMQFITFLIEEKEAKLRLADESKWMQENWRAIQEAISGRDMLEQLRTSTSCEDLNGDVIEVKAGKLGEFVVQTSKSGRVKVRIETFLVRLLACGKVQDFVKVCRLLQSFCGDPAVAVKSENGQE